MAATGATQWEDYDLPLATRLDQISRQRPVTPASTIKVSSRLQIVPPEEPFEIVVPAKRPALDAYADTKEFVAPQYVPVYKLAPVETAPVETAPVVTAPEVTTAEEQIAVLAEIPAVEAVDAMPVIEQAKPKAPPRPVSFQELTELAREREQAQAPEAAEPMVEPLSPAVLAEVAAPVEAVETPAIEAEQAIEPQAHLAPPASYEEGAAPLVDQVATTYEPAPVSEAPELAETRSLEYPAQYEADDIEPVYEEASRQLTTGRWDPIPMLRPDENAWRERLSPTPATSPGVNGPEQPGWTGVDEDQEAWAASAAYRTEPLPAPLLTRQWGLLSKFQQARISSGEYGVAKPAEDEQSGFK
jgi:hypothetical protein